MSGAPARPTLRITAIEPRPPLDPFRPFALRFEIANARPDAPLVIEDARALRLRLTDAAGQEVGSWPLEPAADGGTKRRDRPLCWEIAPCATESFHFSPERLPALPAGELRAALELPPPFEEVHSPPFAFTVAALDALVDQRRAAGTSRTGQAQEQRLVVLRDGWFGRSQRLVLLSTGPRRGLSAVLDGRAPRGVEGWSLLHQWPGNKLAARLWGTRPGQLLVYAVDGHGPIHSALRLADRLSLEPDTEPLAIIELNTTGAVAAQQDLLVVARKGAAIELDYWLRDLPERCWRRCRLETFEGSGSIRCARQEGGFVIERDGVTAGTLALAEELASYRERALASPPCGGLEP